MLAADTDPSALAGLEVVDRRGERLGRVRQVYLDDPGPDGAGLGWVAVRANLLGTAEALVPLAGAVLEDDVLGVPVLRDRFLAAPRRPSDATLGDTEREELRAFYAGTEPGGPAAAVPPPRPADGTDAVAMTAYAERLQVGTERVPASRVRLRKVVVTEQRTVTVAVRREEVRLVREPIDGAAAEPGALVQAAEEELVLHEERVVVTKEVVPVERVRLVRDEVVEDREVTAEVRVERIEADRDPAGASAG